jgi:hypothetical protein
MSEYAGALSRMEVAADTVLSGPFGDPWSVGSDVRCYYEGAMSVLGSPVPNWNDPATPCSLLLRSLARSSLDTIIAESPELRSPERLAFELNELHDDGASCADEILVLPSMDSYRLSRSEPDSAVHELAHRRLTSALSDFDVSIRMPRADESRAVLQAAADIHAAGPGMYSVLTSASGCVLVESSMLRSAYIVDLPMISVIGSRILGSRLDLAEGMLHEACHQKFYDVALVRDIILAGYDYRSGPVVRVPWDPIDGQYRVMDAIRVLAALHVYIHLLIFLIGSQSRLSGADERISTYRYRMRFFMDQVERLKLVRVLGVDGPGFIEWLRECVSSVERAS